MMIIEGLAKNDVHPQFFQRSPKRTWRTQPAESGDTAKLLDAEIARLSRFHVHPLTWNHPGPEQRRLGIVPPDQLFDAGDVLLRLDTCNHDRAGSRQALERF